MIKVLLKIVIAFEIIPLFCLGIQIILNITDVNTTLISGSCRASLPGKIPYFLLA